MFKDKNRDWIRDGGWVLTGFLVFIVVEKLFSAAPKKETPETIDENVSTDMNNVNNNHKDSEMLNKSNNGMLNKNATTIHVRYNIPCNFFLML